VERLSVAPLLAGRRAAVSRTTTTTPMAVWSYFMPRFHLATAGACLFIHTYPFSSAIPGKLKLSRPPDVLSLRARSPAAYNERSFK
jgi:hypothetical protein